MKSHFIIISPFNIMPSISCLNLINTIIFMYFLTIFNQYHNFMYFLTKLLLSLPSLSRVRRWRDFWELQTSHKIHEGDIPYITDRVSSLTPFGTLKRIFPKIVNDLLYTFCAEVINICMFRSSVCGTVTRFIFRYPREGEG